MAGHWCQSDGDDSLLILHVQPGAKQTGIAGMHGEALKIRLAAPPVDGKANDCLMAYLAKTLGVPKSRITLDAGASSRSKRLRIHGLPPAQIAGKLSGPAFQLEIS